MVVDLPTNERFMIANLSVHNTCTATVISLSKISYSKIIKKHIFFKKKTDICVPVSLQQNQQPNP